MKVSISGIGKIWFREQWWDGTHEPLVDYVTWQRVQGLLNRGHYQPHDLLYAGELIKRGHCGLVITGENIKKKQKSGEFRRHTYYRCTRYTAPDHPRIRLSEKKIDDQILAYFCQMRIDDESIKNWFISVIKAKTQSDQKLAVEEITKLNRLQAEIRGKQDRLLNLRMDNEIGKEDFERKNRELREQEGNLSIRLAGLQQDRHENTDLAIKSFELSQHLTERWDTADFDAKRRILEILCLNLTLNGASLDIEWRKPFDIIAKGLNFSASGEDRICSAIRNLLRDNGLEQYQKTIDSKVFSSLGVKHENILLFIATVWSKLPQDIHIKILRLIIHNMPYNSENGQENELPYIMKLNQGNAPSILDDA